MSGLHETSIGRWSEDDFEVAALNRESVLPGIWNNSVLVMDFILDIEL